MLQNLVSYIVSYDTYNLSDTYLTPTRKSNRSDAASSSVETSDMVVRYGGKIGGGWVSEIGVR